MTMAAKSCPARSASAGERLPSAASMLVDQLLLARRQHAMRRQALDRERPGDADAGIVDVGLVVEIFDIGARGDAGVDLLLAGDARFPPFGVRLVGRGGRAGGQFARDLPFLLSLAERRIERGAQRLEHRLPLLPDVVDQRIVGDRLQGDVRHALVDEALADVVVDGVSAGTRWVSSASLARPSRLSASRYQG